MLLKNTHYFSIATAVLLLVVSHVSYAYSYAAAGKEPVIEGRELLMKALTNNHMFTLSEHFNE